MRVARASSGIQGAKSRDDLLLEFRLVIGELVIGELVIGELVIGELVIGELVGG
jgi:hypothetical protein